MEKSGNCVFEFLWEPCIYQESCIIHSIQMDLPLKGTALYFDKIN